MNLHCDYKNDVFGVKEDFDKKQECNRAINPNQIVYIQAYSNYSFIFFTNGKRILTSKTLKYWYGQLSFTSFVRCHQSFLVSKNHIKDISYKSRKITLLNGTEIMASRRQIKQLDLKNNFVLN